MALEAPTMALEASARSFEEAAAEAGLVALPREARSFQQLQEGLHVPRGRQEARGGRQEQEAAPQYGAPGEEEVDLHNKVISTCQYDDL